MKCLTVLGPPPTATARKANASETSVEKSGGRTAAKKPAQRNHGTRARGKEPERLETFLMFDFVPSRVEAPRLPPGNLWVLPRTAARGRGMRPTAVELPRPLERALLWLRSLGWFSRGAGLQLALGVMATFGVVWAPCLAWALEVPPLAGRVNDTAGVLSASEAQALEQRLNAYEQKTGHQFSLLTLPSLEGEDIAGYSIRVAEKWALGDKQRDDGALLLIAVADKKMRIEVGYGLEPSLPDVLAGRIIRNVMAPRFRENDYAGGINAAFDAMMQAAAGEAVGIPVRKPKSEDWHGLAWPLFWLVLFFVIGLSRGRKRGGFVFLPGIGGGGFGSHRGGGFGGGGFGGGGFSGGGGGFGGGGASGGW